MCQKDISDEIELRKYIRGIIKHKIADKYRKASNFEKFITKTSPSISDNSTINSLYNKDLLEYNKYLLEYILKMAKLNPLEKIVFELTLKDFDIAEISKEMGKPKDDIYKIKATMIRKCKKLLTGESFQT